MMLNMYLNSAYICLMIFLVIVELVVLSILFVSLIKICKNIHEELKETRKILDNFPKPNGSAKTRAAFARRA